MKKKIVIFCLTAIILQSCNLAVFEYKKNEQIDLSVRQEIKKLNDRLFNGIRSNDIRSVNTLLTFALIEKSGDDLNKMINVFNKVKIDGYSLLDQYYINSSSIGGAITLASGNSCKDDYVFKFAAPAKESYVSMSLLKNFNNKLLLTTIYGKYEGSWKVTFIRVGEYSFFGKTAQDFYALAQESYQRSCLVDASNYMSEAALCMQPVVSLLQFKKEGEMKNFQDKLNKSIALAYHFPIPVKDINTKPEIISVYPKLENDGFFTTVCYRTNIDLKDTIALKFENKKIQNEIAAIFAGIKMDKKNIFYLAFNELPTDQTKVYTHYGFIEDLTK